MTGSYPTAFSVSSAGPVSASLRAPASKSLTNRAILVAALASGTSELIDPLVSLDTEAMIRAATALGATVRWAGTNLIVHGRSAAVPDGAHIDAGLSGTTLRFAAAAAAVQDQPVTLTGEAPLLRRPVGALSAALRQLGASVVDTDGRAPLTVRGPLAGGTVTVDVAGSSQFLSAVLLAAPYALADVVATGRGRSADAYIEMTADLMRRWGADVSSASPGTWQVRAGRGYTARTEVVEYDASAAAHLYALAAASGGSITVLNGVASTLQPDARVTDVLASMGCEVREEAGAISVSGPGRLEAVHVDLESMPDLLPTMAVLGALAHGTTVITGAAVTRGHETDRIAAVASELAKTGVGIEERDDGLVVHGGSASGPVRLATYDDHRLAMAFAALALAVDGVVIEDPGCVAKTYPGFWDDLAAAGAAVRPAN